MAQARWQWRFDLPPDRLWPVLSDTARFNEAFDAPKYQMEEIPQADGTVLRLARARIGRMNLEWEERPYEWVEGRYWSQRRVFRSGPFRSFGPTLQLTPDGGGTSACYLLEAEPANALGRILLMAGFLRSTGNKVERMARSAARFAAGQRDQAFDYTPAAMPEGAAERLAGMVVEIEKGPYHHGLAARLAEHVRAAQEVDLRRLRPLALARRWKAPPRDVVELCLAAVAARMLEMHWDLLCPRCRGAKAIVPSLDLLPKGAHCPSCAIDYDRDFDRNIELTFSPAAAVRPILYGEYCLSGPMTTPHVRVQQILGPGERRVLSCELPAGAYRLRTLEPGGETELDHEGGAFPGMIGDGSRVTAGPRGAATEIVLENRAGSERTFIVESRDWVRDALTAHQAATLQTFRDLFSSETIASGDSIEVSQVALMFTDLKGSTALYQRIGDAAAFALVRAHFAFLADAVRRRNGAIVKTIGDAVMAAFSDPVDAVAAALAIQQEVAGFNARQGSEAIVIKIGLHAGPCIAVSLNNRLDYFGSTTNLAARLEGQSAGGDIVISETLADDPAVAGLLGSLDYQRETAMLKGFGEPSAFRRLPMGGPAAPGRQAAGHEQSSPG